MNTPPTPADIAAIAAMRAARAASLPRTSSPPPFWIRNSSYPGSRVNPIDLTRDGPPDDPDLNQDPDEGVVGPIEANGVNQYPCWRCDDYHPFPVSPHPPCLAVDVLPPRVLPPRTIRTRSSRMILRSGRRI
jgi:hypothetical protein